MATAPIADTKKLEVLFDARTVPMGGLLSSPDPITLNPGEWAEIQNMRRDHRRVRVRSGTVAVKGAAILGGGQFRGAWEGTLNGSLFLLSAYSDGTDIHLYRSADTGASWSEVTAAQFQFGSTPNKYGKTRFSDHGHRLRFAGVRDPISGRDVVVIQSGAEDARVWDPGGGEAASLQTAIHSTPSLPFNFGTSIKAMPSFQYYFPVSGVVGIPAFAVTGAGMTFANLGVSPQNNLRLTIDATVDNTSSAKLTYSAGRICSTSKQLIVVYQTTLADIWNSLMVEASADNATWFTLYDPTNPTYALMESDIDAEDTDHAFAAFYVQHVTASSIRYIRFSWVGATAPAVSTTTDIFCMVMGGLVPGNAQYIVSYYNPSSRAESYGVVAPTMQGERLADIGGRLFSGERFPVSPKLYYAFKLTVQNNSQVELNKGTSQCRFYRSDAVDDPFRFCSNLVLGTYSGTAWAHVNGELSLRTITENTPTEERDFTSQAPDGDHFSIPMGRAMASSNGGRLFVGGKGSGSSNCIVYISEQKQPFRFKAVADTRTVSPTSFLLEGEDVQAFQPVSTTVLGAASICIFTDRSVWTVDGLSATNLARPSRVSPIGTLSPDSVAEHFGLVFFVDTSMQVGRLAYTVGQITRDVVDDKLLAVPGARREFISGAFVNDRYYLAYTPGGAAANTRALVWLEPTGKILSTSSMVAMMAPQQPAGFWESDDLFPGGVTGEALLKIYDPAVNAERLFAFASAATVYEYDAHGVALDLGAKIPIVLSTREIDVGLQEKLTLLRFGVLSDPDTDSELTITRKYRPGVATETSTLSLDQADEVFSWDGPKDAGDNTPAGAVAQLVITGSLTGGTRIQRMDVEFRVLTGQGRTASG